MFLSSLFWMFDVLVFVGRWRLGRFFIYVLVRCGFSFKYFTYSLQKSFPPFSVNDVKKTGRGRREIGHGNLAERAIAPSIPNVNAFPYTMRTESFITESCGSSSMASVCGGSMCLIDSGVPVKSTVAGVAMGLCIDDRSIGVGRGVGGGGESENINIATPENALILTDIAEMEDHLGKMDFKVGLDGRSLREDGF